MWKKLKKIFAIISRVEDQLDSLKLLISDFEEAKKDGKFTIDEIEIILSRFFAILKGIFPGLQK